MPTRITSCLAALCVFFYGITQTSRAAAPDIVITSANVTSIQGNWNKVAASGVAGGQYMASTDRAWPATEAALAAPADYFEATFSAVANTPYHVWVRLRADQNSKWNDSIWVQFSDALSAVSQSALPVFRTGTTDALLVNLENCSSCGVAGWGWQDKAYWFAQAPYVRFASTGSHTIRIQTREDGVQIDQIVLSSTTYLITPPGQLMNDATIVGGGSVPPATTAAPYYGSPLSIPGFVESSDFDRGGEGIAYHDTTQGNSGGEYRDSDVDIESSADGGYDVGWLAAGEWLNYTVNVANAGTYALTARVASQGKGGTFHLEANRTNASGTLSVPDTGGWQNWTTITSMVALTAGQQSLRIVMDSAGSSGAVGNLGSLKFSFAASPTPVIPAPTTTMPYNGTPAAIPGLVSAETFDKGGEGVAYHDTTAGNTGGAFRETDVDISSSTETPYTVGWIDAGEWLTYSVNVTEPGSYNVLLRVASPSGAAMHVGMGAPSNVWAPAAIPATGSWQSWTTVTVPVALTVGPQTLTLFFDTAGLNISAIRFLKANLISPTPLPTPTPTTPTPAPAPAPSPTPTPTPAPSPSPTPDNTPILVAFTASLDHAAVTKYVLDVYASTANVTGIPLASSDLSKPTPSSDGTITVDRTAFFTSLAAGSYQVTVSAVSSALGRGQSAPVSFTK